jgi:hypothetical protein
METVHKIDLYIIDMLYIIIIQLITMSNFFSSQIIANEFMTFHTGTPPVELFSNPDERFGTLSITVAKTKKTTRPLYIQYTIDVSESMDEKSNNPSRLDYVKRTLVKMFEFLVETIETDVWIHVDTFSTDFSTIIDKVLLTKDNIKELIERVMSLKTIQLTNIELALNNSDITMTSTIQSNPEYNSIHLFLTDGDATVGSRSVDTLVKLVNPAYTNVFIGYGEDHNSQLLSKCANKTLKNKYLFVDNFENTGVVYGEVIHALLYSAVKDVSITMSSNNMIYDATNNQWVQTLQIPFLLSEKEHLYHVKSSSPEDAEAIITGTILNQLDSNLQLEITGENQILSTIMVLPKLEDEHGQIEIELVDLSKYIFRQKTMELLYTASKQYIYNDTMENFKQSLKDFYKKMRLYMEANSLNEDTFMKILCEDIHISYITLGTHEGAMLSESRNTSQRQQSNYRSGSNTYRILRQNAVCGGIQRSCSIQNHYQLEHDYCDEENIDEEVVDQGNNDPTDINNYNTSFIQEDIYSTQETLNIIRAVSS